MATAESAETGPRLIRLRYAGRCEGCAAALPKGTEAWYDGARRVVRCSACGPVPTTSESTTSPGEPPTAPSSPAVIPSGVAGASAAREYARRSARRTARVQKAVAEDEAWRKNVKEAHPVLGRVATALKAKPTVGPVPQHITAWHTGADGEAKVGRRLDEWAAAAPDRYVLHDRHNPKSRAANIDHIAIGPHAVWVIDAKEYSGKVEHVNVGGLFRPDWRLKVGGRNQSKLAESVLWQVQTVADALAQLAGDGPIPPVRGALCFVGADWSLFAKPFMFQDVVVTWPAKMVETLNRTDESELMPTRSAAEYLDQHFRPA